ncbi:MAG: hypothetical protein ABI782_10580 [Anaerolineaceae bacterium]
MNTASAARTLLAVFSGRGIATALVAFLVLVAVPVRVAFADSPPAPDFYWPYGKVQIFGGNLSPSVQPVIAFVNGKACGAAQVTVALPADGTPIGDVGRTVYVIDVLADGTGIGQRPGCGRAGDPVSLYFPKSGVAVQRPLFKQGGERVDLDIGVQTIYHLRAPFMASDGSY